MHFWYKVYSIWTKKLFLQCCLCYNVFLSFIRHRLLNIKIWLFLSIERAIIRHELEKFSNWHNICLQFLLVLRTLYYSIIFSSFHAICLQVVYILKSVSIWKIRNTWIVSFPRDMVLKMGIWINRPRNSLHSLWDVLWRNSVPVVYPRFMQLMHFL